MICDLPAGLFLPLPDSLDEFFTTEVVLRQPFFVQQTLDDHLCRDAGVIHAGLPQSAVALHAVVARERVHDRVLKRVPHVQRAGHVRRRNHDAITRPVAVGREIALGFPALVDALLNFLRLV